MSSSPGLPDGPRNGKRVEPQSAPSEAGSTQCFADEGVSFPPLWLVLLASASPGHWASRARRGQSGGAHCAHPLGWGGRGRVPPLPPRRGGHAPTDLFCAESPSCDGGAEKRSRTGTSGRWVGEGKKRQKEEGKGRNRSSQPGPAQPSPPQPGPAVPWAAPGPRELPCGAGRAAAAGEGAELGRGCAECGKRKRKGLGRGWRRGRARSGLG